MMEENKRPTNLGESFYDVSVLPTRYGITLDILFEKVITFHKNIAKLFDVDPEFIKDLILDKFQYDITKLVEFCTWKTPNSLLVKEKGLYSAKWVDNKEIRTYYDIFVKEDSGLRLLGSEIAQYLLEEKYPYIFKNLIFTDKVNPYADESIFHIRRDTKLRDIGHILHVYSDRLMGLKCDYSVQDLIDVLNGDKRESATKSKFFIYYDDTTRTISLSIYLKLEKDISLTIPFDALKNHDFNLIRKQAVFNIPLGNKKFYDGLQVDAPYFNHPLIKHLEEIFNKYKW